MLLNNVTTIISQCKQKFSNLTLKAPSTVFFTVRLAVLSKLAVGRINKRKNKKRKEGCGGGGVRRERNKFYICTLYIAYTVTYTNFIVCEAKQ